MEPALLSYSYVPDVLARRGPHRDAHLELIARMESEGRLLLGGAVGDPPEGALLVFADAAAAEEFVAADPYAAAGLVAERSIRPWKLVADRPLRG